MTTLFDQGIFGVRVARASALCVLALAAVLLHAGEARAQWTAPDAQGNINSTNTGNVGVGTTAPAVTLHVSSSSTAPGRGIVNEQRSADAQAAQFVMSKSRAGGALLNGDNIANIYAVASDGTSMLSGARMLFAIDGPVSTNNVPTSIRLSTGVNGNGGIERMRITSAGNIGIGATEPGSKFVISANAANPLAPNPANPNVLAPQDGTILHIVNADTQKTRVTIDSFGNSAGPSVSFRAGRGTLAAPTATLAGDALGIVYGGGFGVSRFHNGAKPAMWMVATENWTDTAAGSAIFFNTVQNGSTATVERMRIGSDGNVGIGTTTPASKLHVVGDITVTGNINAKYQDVAEWVPSTEKMAAGTVVVVNADAVNHVQTSTSAYATSVAGVISPQPGLILGEAGEGKALVATTGRVKVKVDATRAPIRAGDLLVTSDVAGVAMKSVPVSVGGVEMHRPGTIIGKALEPLAKGTGEILVLLSLQ